MKRGKIHQKPIGIQSNRKKHNEHLSTPKIQNQNKIHTKTKNLPTSNSGSLGEEETQ